MKNSLPERCFKIRDLTLEVILGHWLSTMKRRNAQLSIEVEINQIEQQQKSDDLDFEVHS